MITEAQSLLWTELYRPKTLDEIILPARIKQMFQTENIQNYIFYGPSGTGKTTLARILAKKYNALVINASLENGIDTIRHKVDNFCGLRSLSSTAYKLVYFDESDKFSVDAQEGLRGVIEEYSDRVRFIFTCNRVEKIIQPLRSRLVDVNFDFSGSDEEEQTRSYVKRIQHIAEVNGMNLHRDAIIHIFKTHFPDMRSIVQRLETLYRSGIVNVTVNDVNKSTGIKNEELFKFLCSNPMPTTISTMVSTFKGKESTLISDLSTNFISYISNNPNYLPKIGDVAIKIHQYSYESKFVIDPYVTLLAMCYEISLILK